MSFFCPHFQMEGDRCAKLNAECVPGRPGCVLRGKVDFATPAEERLKQRPLPPREKRTTSSLGHEKTID